MSRQGLCSAWQGRKRFCGITMEEDKAKLCEARVGSGRRQQQQKSMCLTVSGSEVHRC